jgi:uncharacterized protein YndB with AHSA1/START domain
MNPVAPIRKEIVVNASQERCFRVFTAGMDKWWPREHHIGKSPLKEFLMEPREGGRWDSVCEDGSEIDVGRVLVWEPVSRLVLTWQITAKWQYDASFVTEVELRFFKEADKKTRVELEHRKLEAYGADAAAMHKTFSADDAWLRTLALFGSMAEKAT